MLGLRRIEQSLRNRRSISSSHSSQHSAEDTKTEPTMPSLVNGSQASSDVVKQTTTSTNNVDVSSSTAIQTTNHSERRSSMRIQVTQTIKTTKRVRARLVHELDEVDEAYLQRIDLQAYLRHIANERIFHMPKRGSQWDQVLKEAEFFGLQIDEFTAAVQEFITDSITTRDTALASCYLLLQLGCEQAQALEPTFSTLYELGQLLANTLELRSLFVLSEEIAQALSEVIIRLIHLLGDIAIFYHQRISRLSKETVTIDFDREFGDQLEVICSKREQLIYKIWSYKLGGDNVAGDVVSLHRELGSGQTHVKSYLYGRISDKKRRVERTCEWLEYDLEEFAEKDEKVLTITGSPGSGKSMLAAWTRQQLERPTGHLEKHRIISYEFTADYPERSTTVSALKSLLSQLLEISIGDTHLFEKLSSLLPEKHNEKEFVSQLWVILEDGLKTIDRKKAKVAIVIDGLDEIVGGDVAALEFYKNIHQVAKNLEKIRAFTFSRHISHLGQFDSRHIVVTPELVNDDIQRYLLDGLSKRSVYASESDTKRQELLLQLVSRAKGSFLFAYLSLKLIDAGVDFDSFHKLIQVTKPDPSENHHSLLKELIHRTNLKDAHTNSLLTFMVATERPLQLEEAEDLLSVDLSNPRASSRANVRKVLAATNGLLVEYKGMVRFKHSIVRNYVRELCGSVLVLLKDSHRILTMTLLLFAKNNLTQSCEPSFDIVNRGTIDQAYNSHAIMQYISQYWIIHFKKSSLISTKGDLALTQDFKSVFPESTFFVMTEWYSWQSHPTSDFIHFHDLALRIRSACFGEKHRTILQSLIILGITYRSRSEDFKAAEFFYRASSVGRTVLYKFSPLVVSCTVAFLTCTEKMSINTRTTLVTYREEMIRFYIEVCKGQYGRHSDQVIRWSEALVELYRSIREEHMAAVILKELREITIIRFGRGSDKTRGLTRELAELNVVLKKGKTQQTKDQDDELLFEASEGAELTDEWRIEIILQFARAYESEHKFILAEKLYVALWSRICTACRQKTTVELQLAQLNIALEYVHFLQRLKRGSEACNIMVCVWAEYEHRKFESKKILLRLKELSVLFRKFGLLAISVSILKKAWSWFKERKMTETEEAYETTTIITEVVKEITETTTEVTTTTTETEAVTREVYETTYTRAKSGKVDRHFFKASLALVNLHIKLQQWSEAEVVLRRSLEIMWKGVLTVDEKLTLEGSFTSETVTTALSLALCYHRQRKFDKAQQIYLRVWRACLVSLKAEDALLIETTTKLIAFYEEFHRYEEIIETHKQLLQHYRQHLGVTHKLTIQVLYKLASTYRLLGRKEAYEYYCEIVKTYTHNGICRHEGFQAANIVLKYYREEQRWKELQDLCVVLWTSITKHHHERKVSEEFVITIYEAYRYVLEFHSKVEFSVLYKLTVEYRETVKTIFGVSVAIYLTASIALAEICEKSEERYVESVTIYEEVITRTKTVTTLTETKIRTIKKRLSTLYVTVITRGKKTEKSTFERAIEVCSETYEQYKIEFGWWHEATLLKLKELVLLYSKYDGGKTQVIVQMLQESVVKILTSTTVAIELYKAALTIASIYKTVKLESSGQELLRQLQILILFPGFDILQQKVDLKVDFKFTRVAFVFLIALEEGLHHPDGKPGHDHFSQLMADLILESLLYEQYYSVTTNITEKTSTQTILEHSARLRSLWVARGRTTFVSVLERNVLAIFTERYAKELSSYVNDPSAVSDLCLAILTEIGDNSTTERTTINFALATVKAINNTVRILMVDRKDFLRAHAVAKSGFQFANAQRFYHDKSRGVIGYKLAQMLAGHDIPGWKPTDATQRESMLQSSRTVLQTVFAAFREAGVDFVSLHFEDLSSLINLLGDQKNYGELETLLKALWQSREIQRSWSPANVLQIGRLLIDAHVLASHNDDAVALAENLYYNVRESRGGLDTYTLAVADKLTVLLARLGRSREAVRVHNWVLRDLDEHSIFTANNGDAKAEKDRLRATADQHLTGLRRCGWASRPEGARTATALHAKLGHRYGGLTVPPVEKWGAVDPKKNRDLTYSEPTTWSLDVEKETTKRDWVAPAKERWGYFVRTPEVVA
ncbi:uncharacterized protein F4822DRAFT_388082 [Hypoxylon trugodes]|uniref:uncharacterized protein n=1 Tax=Hypoxylon trugodes TaxID=326681 RepID=UPI0021917FC1|nr:uncharacterized protein F4822DRAFT_388082 [Hypoxylon trugodes]KAI1394396.1 hypothetical protein F4822DRAFT_388082 [Hypoxylon trugodes]